MTSAPAPAPTPTPTIRPYHPTDREALDDICVRTAHVGQDSRPHYADPGIFPAIFAAPYVQLEPESAFVLDDGQGRVVGYVVGTADTSPFRRGLPGEVAAVCRRPVPGAPAARRARRTRRSSRCCITPTHARCRRSPTIRPICTSTCSPSGRGGGHGRSPDERHFLDALHRRRGTGRAPLDGPPPTAAPGPSTNVSASTRSRCAAQIRAHLLGRETVAMYRTRRE